MNDFYDQVYHVINQAVVNTLQILNIFNRTKIEFVKIKKVVVTIHTVTILTALLSPDYLTVTI